MISFVNVSKYYRDAFGHPKIVLNRANVRIDAHERIGILAPAGGGKTTVARLMSGTLRPSAGAITRTSRLSWPLAYASALHPALSSAQNVALAARLHNLDPEDLVLRVAHFADIGDAFERPVAALSPAERLPVAMGLSLSVSFDTYIADEFSAVGAPAFQDKVEAALEARLATAGLILFTRHTRLIERLTTRTAVLANGQIIDCTSTEEARLILDLAEQPSEDPSHAA